MPHRRLNAALAHPLGGPVRVAYRGVQGAMLAALAAYDRLAWRGRPSAVVSGQVTFIVKTFERPGTLRRFLTTARRIFAGRIIVADDSRRPFVTGTPGVDVIALPFDSGVSVGRNAALAAVRTPYVAVCDDDLVFTRGSDWEPAWRYLETHPELDAVVPQLVEVPQWYAHGASGCGLFRGHADPRVPAGTLIDGLRVVAKPPQVYLGRTDSIRRVGWDENLHMIDHRDFFSRAAGELVFVEEPRIRVFHARTPFLRTYTTFRDGARGDRLYLAQTWGGGCSGCANGAAVAG